MRLAAIALWAAATSCQAIYGSNAVDNPDNCSSNAALCAAPDQACNSVTKLCEPAIQLSAVQAVRASNVGGTSVTLTGKRLTPDLTINFAGVPATQLMAVGSDGTQLTLSVPPKPGASGPVAIELIHPLGQRQLVSGLFSYYAPIALRDISPAASAGPSDSVGTFGGDFNRDGLVDVLICDPSPGNLWLLPGKGDGTFATAQMTPLLLTAAGCSMGDVNGDGILDVAVANGSIGSAAILFGDGHGALPGAAQLASSAGTVSRVSVDDVDGDGRPDLVTQLGVTPRLAILLQQADGSFADPKVVSVPNSGSRWQVADMNGDGVFDLVWNNVVSKMDFGSFVGLADGTFTDGQTLSIGQGLSGILAVDLNGDKLPEVVQVDRGLGKLKVLLNVSR